MLVKLVVNVLELLSQGRHEVLVLEAQQAASTFEVLLVEDFQHCLVLLVFLNELDVSEVQDGGNDAPHCRLLVKAQFHRLWKIESTLKALISWLYFSWSSRSGISKQPVWLRIR